MAVQIDERNLTMMLVAVILMDLLTGMEFDLFVPSFPELQLHFGLTPFWVEALLSANFIGYCLSLFCVGSLADRYGRKPIILSGLMIFVIGSVMCVAGISYPFLLVGRFLQGMGIAAPAILSFLIIADAYPLKKQQFFMAMLNGAMNISVGIAPVIGSYIALYFHWRGNFALLLALGISVLLMAVLFVPTAQPTTQKEALSWRGYLPLFQSKPLMLLLINVVLMMVPYWIFVGMSPLLYMKNLGVSLSHFGYYQGVLALAFALGSIGFGLVMHRTVQKKLLTLVGILYVLSFIAIAGVTLINSHSPLLITLALLVFTISEIIPSTLLGPLCLNIISHAKARVSAVLQALRLLATALSLQLAGYFYQGTFLSVGVILLAFILMLIITHFFVVRNSVLMSFSSDTTDAASSRG